MKITSRELFPHPGYEVHVAMSLLTDSPEKESPARMLELLTAYPMGPGTRIEDILIPGTDAGSSLKLRVITPPGLPENPPLIMDIHGGAWVGGSLDIDNYRCIYLAEHTPCIVVSVEYRLATKRLPFPAPLMDCVTAYLWLRNHAGEIGGDPERIGVHGTSAGGNLAAGLGLYLRDHGQPQAQLTAINCPALDYAQTTSKAQFGPLGGGQGNRDYPEFIYCPRGGSEPSYYAFPSLCRNLNGLAPHMVVVGEYDPLRDEGLDYAMRLLHDNVSCALISAPRVTHGFCVVDKPLTRWVHNGMCASFRREFGMETLGF